MNIFAATRFMVSAAIVIAASACGGGDGPTPPAGGVASLALSPSTDIRLYSIGETTQLTATPKDESGNTISANVTYASSNPAVATVSGAGLITATGVGTTKITATAGSISKEITVTVQQSQFNVQSAEGKACTSPDLRGYKFEAQSAHLLIVSDPANPPNGFTAADYQEFAATFESLVWPVVTANFGVPADIDGNGKVIAYFTRAVNELTRNGSVGVTGGFFFGRDLFPKVSSGGLQGCAGSNQAEMFYLLAPDPTGVVNGNVRLTADVKRITLGVIGHELQHLINSSRRLFINQGAIWPETSYMEEGLSHIAEELLFYEAGGLLPRSNLGLNDIRASQQRVDAFNAYMGSNAGRFSLYLKSPTINAPVQGDDDLETRGAIWAFLRYLADRGAPGTPFSEAACTPPVTLAFGGRCRVDGAAAAQFNVSPGATGGEYAIIAFAADLAVSGSLSTTASATSAIAVTGPPTPWAAPGGAQLSTFGSASLGGGSPAMMIDNSLHSRLRAIERRELRSRVAGARTAYSMTDRSSARFSAASTSGPSMAAVVVEPVWGQLVNSNDTGIVNLRGRFGADITGAERDWAVANYADDTVIPNLPSQYMHPSWNFRSLLAGLSSNGASGGNPGTYPLLVNSLIAPKTVTMTNGGAAYYRFGVPAGATSSVTFTANGSAPPSNLKLVVVRTK